MRRHSSVASSFFLTCLSRLFGSTTAQSTCEQNPCYTTLSIQNEDSLSLALWEANTNQYATALHSSFLSFAGLNTTTPTVLCSFALSGSSSDKFISHWFFENSPDSDSSLLATLLSQGHYLEYVTEDFIDNTSVLYDITFDLTAYNFKTYTSQNQEVSSDETSILCVTDAPTATPTTSPSGSPTVSPTDQPVVADEIQTETVFKNKDWFDDYTDAQITVILLSVFLFIFCILCCVMTYCCRKEKKEKENINSDDNKKNNNIDDNNKNADISKDGGAFGTTEPDRARPDETIPLARDDLEAGAGSANSARRGTDATDRTDVTDAASDGERDRLLAGAAVGAAAGVVAAAAVVDSDDDSDSKTEVVPDDETAGVAPRVGPRAGRKDSEWQLKQEKVVVRPAADSAVDTVMDDGSDGSDANNNNNFDHNQEPSESGIFPTQRQEPPPPPKDAIKPMGSGLPPPGSPSDEKDDAPMGRTGSGLTEGDDSGNESLYGSQNNDDQGTTASRVTGEMSPH